MFFLLDLKKNVQLSPRFFGPKMVSTIRDKLVAEVEGTCSGRYGYIIGVLGKPTVGKGFAMEDHSGQAVFEVKYQAIVFRPFKGEVLDAIVYNVSKMGFFAQAGPLEIFVSTHLIPTDYTFSSLDEPCFVSEDTMTRIQQDAVVRLRIIGIQVDPSKIFAVATIKDEYLGVVR